MSCQLMSSLEAEAEFAHDGTTVGTVLHCTFVSCHAFIMSCHTICVIHAIHVICVMRGWLVSCHDRVVSCRVFVVCCFYLISHHIISPHTIPYIPCVLRHSFCVCCWVQVAPGMLITFLQKGLAYVGIEEHLNEVRKISYIILYYAMLCYLHTYDMYIQYNISIIPSHAALCCRKFTHGHRCRCTRCIACRTCVCMRRSATYCF